MWERPVLNALVVADKLHQIALRIGHIKRAPLHTCVLGGFNWQSQTLQPRQFVCEIGEGYLESDVVNGRSWSIRPTNSRDSANGRTRQALGCDRRSHPQS